MAGWIQREYCIETIQPRRESEGSVPGRDVGLRTGEFPSLPLLHPTLSMPTLWRSQLPNFMPVGRHIARTTPFAYKPGW